MHLALASRHRVTPSLHTARNVARPRSRIATLAVLAVALVAFAPAAFSATMRYASSTNRIYIENGGGTTLSEIKAALPSAPLEQVDPEQKIWLLRANIQIEDGSALHLRGAALGGDVNELRLLSDNAADGPGFVTITADYGEVFIEATKVTSWDTAAGAPDSDYSNGRAYIRVRSSLSDLGQPLESRMDILDSEVAYLGFNTSEGYGLSWKVNGTAEGLFDQVQVWGNVINSRIHHNYFGVYTYGLQDGVMRGNEVYENVQYGLDPHDDSDNLIIEKNFVHGNGNHGIIASQRCDHAVIRENRSIGNKGNGIMLHRSSDDAVVENNETSQNEDAGIALFATDRTVVRGNIIHDNGLAGVRLSMGSADNIIEDNEIANSAQFGIYLYQGTDVPDPGDDGRTKRNIIRNNDIRNIAGDAVKLSDGDGNRFVGNTFAEIGTRFYVSNALNTVFEDNVIPDGVAFSIHGSPEFPTQIDFIRQRRVELSMDSDSLARFLDPEGAVFDVRHNDLFTTITGSASSLELNQKQVGSGTAVDRRELYAQTAGSVVSAFPTVWTEGGDNRRGWTAKVDDPSAEVQYTVGDLTPGATYEAFHGATSLGTFVASDTGRVSFAVTPGSNLTQSYSVVEIAGKGGGGGGSSSRKGGGAMELGVLSLLALLAVWRRRRATAATMA